MPMETAVPPLPKMLSMLSKFVLSFPPHVSVEAPTSGLVRPRLVVLPSAIVYVSISVVVSSSGSWRPEPRGFVWIGPV